MEAINEATKDKLLEKILNSTEFCSSHIYGKYLTYLVNASLENKNLKETSIAFEFFEKDADFNPAVIYLGTDRGVYRSADDGKTWTLFGVGLPHCAVNDIIVDSHNNRILAATQGRGIWEVVLGGKRKKKGGNRR